MLDIEKEHLVEELVNIWTFITDILEYRLDFVHISPDGKVDGFFHTIKG